MTGKFEFFRKVPALPGIIVTLVLIAGILLIRVLGNPGAALKFSPDTPSTLAIIGINSDLTLKTEKYPSIPLGGIVFPIDQEARGLVLAALEKMLAGKECRIEPDPYMTNDPQSQFGFYIYSGDRFVNLELLREGYAVSFLDGQYVFRNEFFGAENDARKLKKGFWANSAGMMTALRFMTLPAGSQDMIYAALAQSFPQYDTAAKPLQTADIPPPDSGTVISWENAGQYIGKTVTVNGKIVLTKNTGKVCFLNFHPDYKKHLSAVIFSSAFQRFPMNPENVYLNKTVLITGKIVEYEGRPEIILDSPSQIKIVQ